MAQGLKFRYMKGWTDRVTSGLILKDSEIMLSQIACWTKDAQYTIEFEYLENQTIID